MVQATHGEHVLHRGNTVITTLDLYLNHIDLFRCFFFYTSKSLYLFRVLTPDVSLYYLFWIRDEMVWSKAEPVQLP